MDASNSCIYVLTVGKSERQKKGSSRPGVAMGTTRFLASWTVLAAVLRHPHRAWAAEGSRKPPQYTVI